MGYCIQRMQPYSGRRCPGSPRLHVLLHRIVWRVRFVDLVALCRGRKTTLLPEPPGYLAWTNLCQEDGKWPVYKNLLTTPLKTIYMSKSHQKHRRQILLPRRFPISISTLKTTYSALFDE